MDERRSRQLSCSMAIKNKKVECLAHSLNACPNDLHSMKIAKRDSRHTKDKRQKIVEFGPTRRYMNDLSEYSYNTAPTRTQRENCFIIIKLPMRDTSFQLNGKTLGKEKI